MNNLQVKRNELKYYVSGNQCILLAKRLGAVLSPDSYTVPGEGYFIRSLYFDSHDNQCLYEKQSGFHARAKYRLRIYDVKSDVVKFEIKNKLNNQIFKESATITRESAYELIDGNYNELLKYDNTILNKAYKVFIQGNYKPKVIIDYTREAYVYGAFDLRITLDKNIKSNNTDFDLFSEEQQSIPVILEQKQVLEVKYSTVLPEYIRLLLQFDGFERMAISKYALGRRFLKIDNWEDN